MDDAAGLPPHFGQADLTDCDREPIRTPGSIQPHGVLLTIDPISFEIVQIGGDTMRLLGLKAEDLVGRSLEASLGRAVLLRMQSLIEHQQIFPKPSLVFETELGGRDLDVCAHLSSGVIILELEWRTGERALDAIGLLHEMIRMVESAGTPQALAEAMSRAVQNVTGFDRVMIYKFLEDDSGHVIAESLRSDSVESFFDLHYPASDIPTQARALYLSNWIRCIPDARYAPLPLVPVENPSHRFVAGPEFQLSAQRVADPPGVPRQYGRDGVGVAVDRCRRAALGADRVPSPRAAILGRQIAVGPGAVRATFVTASAKLPGAGGCCRKQAGGRHSDEARPGDG